ncbi:MAG: hypothetical protein KKA07_13085, partial [Bacteroidetes bacterium]|nr:hypothetical protein [Bacteroidota bacterium]
MSQSVSISEKEPTRDILDFEFLKQTGIGYIEQLSGKVWTDYNLHDPGITLLEALSYALTELGYRSRHSVKDLLARAVYTRQKQGKELLIDASEILVSAPVTINDYRKLLIDIDGVKNVHITPDSSLPDFNGLYNLQIELFPDYDDNFNRAIIKNEVSLILNQNRNLAEDFNTISFLEHDPISFEIEIETDGKQNASELLYDIYSRLADHLSPGIQFYDLAALLAKGYTVDQIFNGPLLKNGFILDEELEQLRLRQQIYTSDIVHFLMDIEGVSYVKNIKIHKSGAEHFNWTCPVAKGKAPELDV